MAMAQTAIFWGFCALLIVAAGFDFVSHRIPNWLSGTVFALGLVAGVAFLPVFSTVSEVALQHLGAFAITFVLGALLFQFRQLGGGDVKLWAAIALWIGLPLLPTQMIYAGIAGGVVTLVAMLGRQVVPHTALTFVCARLGVGVPPMFLPGGKIPYGIAISAGTLMVADRVPFLVESPRWFL
jgi:prepilin peptidase CpaA